MPTSASTREVIHGDAMAWLRGASQRDDASFVTSLPDLSEMPGLDLNAWTRWFEDAAALILERTAPEAVAIFFQSDIRAAGVWIDKGHLVHRAADRMGARCMWHKIVCRKPPGTSSFGRATYSHMLCFSKALEPKLARGGVDVLPDPGTKTWSKATGAEACLVACRAVREQTRSRMIIDPFCGHGTVLAAANALGFDALGVELSERRCARARALTLRP